MRDILCQDHTKIEMTQTVKRRDRIASMTNIPLLSAVSGPRREYFDEPAREELV